MRRFHFISCMVVFLSIVVAACGGVKDAPPPQDQEPAISQNQENQPAEPEPESPTPTLQPINLAGPPAGTPMVWVDGSILVHVPGGEFIMGDGGDDNPVHAVGLSSFWIYRTKVTNRMYSVCVAAGRCTPPLGEEAVQALSDPTRRDFPVVNVNWQQADAYCKFVEGHLPTEAQWEKSARGPDGNIYPWGDAAPDCGLMNFKGCVGDISNVFDYPVGKSFYNALDFSGNVFEWVADWYTPQYYSESPGADPLGPDVGAVRSVRSSSFFSEKGMVSSARRYFLDPESHRVDLGFRCVVGEPTEYEPFCEQVYIPGYPESEETREPAASENCPVPEFTTFVGECIDQEGQVGNGSVRIEGGEIVSVVGDDCAEFEPGLWFCTGPQGTGVSVTACLACETDGEAGRTGGVECPPGTYDDGQGNCIGQGGTGLCPNGYDYDVVEGCCSPGPGISYPGCDPDEEFLTALSTCQPGSPPLGDACGVVSVPMGSCKPPAGEEEPGAVDLCNRYTNEKDCFYYGSNMGCYWNGRACVAER